MASSGSTLDLTATTANFKINSKGSAAPILWRLGSDPVGNLTTPDMTGYSARLLGYSDCDLTDLLWTKTTANGGLELVTNSTKTFTVDGVDRVLANPWGVMINITEADADQVAALGDEGLHYLLFLTPPAQPELPLFAKGMVISKGVC